MSTKIYTGFMFKGKDLMQIHREIMKFRKEAAPVVKEATSKWMIGAAVQVIDGRALGLLKKEREPVSPYYYAFRELTERQKKIKQTMMRDPDVDFSFELAIIPIRGKILGMYFSEYKPLIEMWKAKKFFMDYHYQNSTDRPDHISAREWSQRCRDWDRAMPLHCTPAESGFSAMVTPHGTAHVSVDDVMAYMPRLQDRARAMAKNMLLDAWLKKAGVEIPSHVIRAMHDFYDWMKERDGKKALKRKVATVKKRILRRITKDHLVGNRK